VASHSGKLTGSHDLWRAIAREHGIVAVETPAELVDCTYLLARKRFTARPSVAFVGSGGHGVMFADAAERAGVVLSRLRPETANTLVARLPKEASVGNPIDPTPVPDSTYFAAVEAVLTDPDVNAAVVQVTSLSRDYDDVAGHVDRLLRENATRDAHLIFTYYAPSDTLSDHQQKDVQDAGAFVIESPTRAATALGAISAAFGDDLHASPPPVYAPDASLRSVLGWGQIAPILEDRRLATAPSAFVASPAELVDACADLGWPLVLKLETPSAPHKSDLRLVEMGIETSDAALAAYERLARERLKLGGAILVQHQLRSGVEILLGFRRDPEFGPSLIIGSGGVNAELLEDTVTALCPIDPATVRRLLVGTRVGRLLEASRTSTPHDVDALVELVAACSNLFVELNWLELEFNPVIVQAAGLGCAIVDALGVPS
jgi:acyl-CoA synthetase (NDP forming)